MTTTPTPTAPALAFGYPRRGLEGRFNTFRLGKTWAARAIPGATVELIDSRSKKLLKHARVLTVVQGTLIEMAQLHAREAHNWKGYPEAERPALLVASMKKRYPPGRATDDSVVTVIYLEELPNATLQV